MNSTLYKLLILATAYLTLAACAKDKSSEPVAPPTSNGGRLVLSADLGDNFAVDISDEDNLKMLSIFQKNSNEKSPFTFEIDINQYGSKQMHLFLKRPDHPEIVELFTPVSITKTTSGQYRMSAVVENVQVPYGVDLTQGDWYITGFWGGSDKNTTGDQYKHKVAEVAPKTPSQVGEKVEMDIPLGFPWTRITGSQTGSNYTLQHLDLKIRPMGVLISLFLENRTRYTANITALDKEMVGFAFGGYFNPAASTAQEIRQGGVFPKFEKFAEENINNEFVNIFPGEIVLASGAKSEKPVYIWAMPTETNANSTHALSFTFISKERTTMDEDLYIDDRFDKNGVGRFKDRYVMDLAFKKTPGNSQYFIRPLKIRSGLMITEYFINRHRIEMDQPKLRDIREPNFLGYVELYNPNLDPIDLEHYALARISNLRRVTFYGISFKNGTNYAFFHPFADEAYKKWKQSGYRGDPSGRADRHANKDTRSHMALLLSLQLKNNAKSSFQPNSLGFSSPLETGGGIEKRLVYNTSNDSRTEKVRFIKKPGSFDNNKAKLSGGKTMLLLGNGFIKEGDPSDIPSYRYSYYAESYDNKYHTGYFKPINCLTKEAWQSIVNDPRCEIIVAVDNYEDRNAYPNYPKAGVMNLNWSDALLLVQKHPKDSSRRRIVDATSTHPFSRVDNWVTFVDKVTLVSETEIGYAHFRVRTVAQHMPEFLNFSYTQWYSERFHQAHSDGYKKPLPLALPAKVSPGRRSTNPAY